MKRYKIYEQIVFSGMNNDDVQEKEYLMDEVQLELLKQKLAEEGYTPKFNGTRYTKCDGVYILNEDKVKRAVARKIEAIARDFFMDTNTKEWEDVRTAMEAAMIASDSENHISREGSCFHEFRGACIEYGIEDYNEYGNLHYAIEQNSVGIWHDPDEDKFYKVYLTGKEENDLLELKPDRLYGYLKSKIGVQTSEYSDGLHDGPMFRIGRLAVSIKLNYGLRELRYGRCLTHDPDPDHSRPMTEEEFEKVLPDFDTPAEMQLFTVNQNGSMNEVGRNHYMSLNEMCDVLHTLASRENVVLSL